MKKINKMSLIDFIQKIQKKPRYTRIQFLWTSVFICMFFIVSIWVFSLKYSLSIEDDDKKDANNISNDMISLKDAFKASINAFFEKEPEDDFKQTESQTETENKDKTIDEIKPAKLPLSR